MDPSEDPERKRGGREPVDGRVVHQRRIHCVAMEPSNSLIAVETWNGTTWRLWQPPVPPPAILPAISCGSANGCEVVGDRTNEKDDVVSAAEKWDGSQLRPWSIPKVLGGELLAASCSNSSRCMAVGDVTAESPNELAGTVAELERRQLATLVNAQPRDCRTVQG